VVPPVLEKPGGFGRHAPVARIDDGTPLVLAAPQLIDDRRGVILLAGGGDTGALVEYDRLA
jgi:hypothetical protein